MRWNIGPFGAKDLFTVVNLLGGIFAVHFVVTGQPTFAGYALLAGYMLGDTLDGPVARLTKTSNKFGSEFDTATDHFVQGIAPALIVYAVYARAGQTVTGVVLDGPDDHLRDHPPGAVLGGEDGRSADVHGAAAYGQRLRGDGVRAVVVLLRNESRARYTLGGFLIPAFALLNLLPIPYMTHRGARRMQTPVKFLVVGFLVLPTAALLFARQYTFDVLFVFTFGYAALAWMPIYPHEKKAFFAALPGMVDGGFGEVACDGCQ